MGHAIIHLDGMKIPLIGIPEDETLERCDRCGEKDNISMLRVQKDGKSIKHIRQCKKGK